MENGSCITLTFLWVRHKSGTCCAITWVSLMKPMEQLTAVKSSFSTCFPHWLPTAVALCTSFPQTAFSFFPSAQWCSQLFGPRPFFSLPPLSTTLRLFWSLAPVLISLFSLPTPQIPASFFHPPVCSSRLQLLQALCPSSITWDKPMYSSILEAQAGHEAFLKRESCQAIGMNEWVF